jgi:membrane fusion protein, copper/silver efflux system
MKKFMILILVVAAGAIGWFVGKGKTPAKTTQGERKVAFYQSSMHPWIKSDKPGNCTICGMKLTPVYEGEKGFDTDSSIITLSSNAINVLNVQTEPVAKVPLERTLEVGGRVEADQTRSRVLSAYVDGRVEKLFVNFTGADVNAGEPLAVIYSPALLTAEREYLTVLAQTNFANSPRLAEEHDRFVEGAKQRLKRLGLTDEQIEKVRAGGAATNFTTQIVAPISGTVVKREVFEGQYVKEGDRMFELIDLSQLWFVFDVYEQDLPAVQLGQVVQVTSPALPGKRFEGPITFIEPSINEATRSARVRVELQNPVIDGKRALYNGLYASGRIAFKSEPVLAVTRSAVMEPGDQPRVYVDHGAGAYEQRLVQLGRRGENFIEVQSGLEAGERVVSNGNLLLDSQAQINRGVSGSAAHQHGTNGPAPAHKHTAIDEKEGGELPPFFAAVSGLNQALANDDVKTYNERLAKLPVPAHAELAALTTKLKERRTDTLDAARVEFLPFSVAVAEVAQAFRKTNRDAAVKVYKCPMFPRPGKDAFWVQTEGPLRNPFYGSEMIDCGTEVK